MVCFSAVGCVLVSVESKLVSSALNPAAALAQLCRIHTHLLQWSLSSTMLHSQAHGHSHGRFALMHGKTQILHLYGVFGARCLMDTMRIVSLEYFFH